MEAWTSLQQVLPEIIAGLEKRVPYAYALVTQERDLRIRVSHSETLVRPTPALGGIVLGVFNGRQFYEWSTTEIFPEKVIKWAASVGENIPSAGAQPRLKMDPGPVLERSFSTAVDADPDDVSLREKMEWCLNRHHFLKKQSRRLVNAEISYNDHTTHALFVNRHKILTQRLVRTEMAAIPYLAQNGVTSYNYDGVCKAQGFELTAEGLSDDKLRRLISDTEALLGAPRIIPGVYDVVMDPNWSGLLAHEAFGHGMETDMFLRGRARGADFINQQVAAPTVNMLDNPALPGEAGTFFFDDEGWIAEPTQVIENGILKGGMTDAFSAIMLGLKRTANGRRESPLRKAYARMTNTYFTRGDQTLEQLIGGVDQGFYLTYPTNGMEDPQGWGMQLEGLCAREIKNGRLTEKVHTPVIVTGSVPDILKSISGIGSDFWIGGTGHCGKGHKEILKNTCGGPSLRLRARLA